MESLIEVFYLLKKDHICIDIIYKSMTKSTKYHVAITSLSLIQI